MAKKQPANQPAKKPIRYGRYTDGNQPSVDPASKVAQAAPNFGREFLPQILTYSGMQSTVSHTYRNPDEAIRHSLENARIMRKDCSVMESLEGRQRSVALLNWHLEPEDDKDERQKELVTDLTNILGEIERFTEYRRNLMEAAWYGRAAIANRYVRKIVRGTPRFCIRHWTPVNGDKLAFRFDDGSGKYDPNQIGIRVGGAFSQHDKLAGDRKIELTEFGQCYFLEPWERTLLTVHKHMIEDGEFEDPLSAGRVHGVGIRDRIYWCWFQKQNTMAQLMEVIERTGTGFTIYYYQHGNKESKNAMEDVAMKQAPSNVILMPRMAEDGAMSGEGIERIEPSTAGIDAMKSIIGEFFGWQIKRYILGQTLSSEASATGLGSGVADLHQDTFMQIVQYDAINLEETLTTEVVEPLKNYNFPWARDLKIKFKIDTKDNESEKKLSAFKQAWDMGARLKVQDVMDVIGAAMPTEEDEVLQNPALMQQQRLCEQAHAGPGDIGQAGGVVGEDGQEAPEGSIEDQFGPIAGLLGGGGDGQAGGDEQGPPGGGGGGGGNGGGPPGNPPSGPQQYAKTDVFIHDGRKYDLRKLRKIMSARPQANYYVSQLKWILAENPPSKRDYIRAKNTHLSVPVFIAQTKDGKLVPVDGYHRLLKCVEEGRSEIVGKRVRVEDLLQCEIPAEAPQRFAKQQVKSSPGQTKLFDHDTSRATASKWKEELHPREADGKFGEKGAGHVSSAVAGPNSVRAKQAASSPGQKPLGLAGDAAEQIGMPTGRDGGKGKPTLPALLGMGEEQPFALSGKPVKGKTTFPGSGATKQQDLFAGRGDAPGQTSFFDDVDPAAKSVGEQGKPLPATKDIGPGDTVTIPASNTFGQFEAEITDEGEGRVGIRQKGSKDARPIAKMHRNQLPQFLDDLNGVIHGKPDSASESVNHVLAGKGKFLGRGNDGLAFDAGNGQVVKASSDIPFHWNNGLRDNHEGRNILQNQVKVNEHLRAAGVPGLLPQELHEHGGRTFVTMPKVNTEAKLTPEHVQQLRNTLNKMHDAGYALKDLVQVGIDHEGNARIFDTGAAKKLDKNPTYARDDMRSDEHNLNYLIKKHGHDEVSLNYEREYGERAGYTQNYLSRLENNPDKPANLEYLKSHRDALVKSWEGVDDDTKEFLGDEHADTLKRLDTQISKHSPEGKLQPAKPKESVPTSRPLPAADNNPELPTGPASGDSSKDALPAGKSQSIASDPHLERARSVLSRIPKVTPRGLSVQLNGEVSEEHAAELLAKLRGEDQGETPAAEKPEAKPAMKGDATADAAFDRLNNALAGAAEMQQALKDRSMIYQVDRKEEVAEAHGKPRNAYHNLPYKEWSEIDKAHTAKERAEREAKESLTPEDRTALPEHLRNVNPAFPSEAEKLKGIAAKGEPEAAKPETTAAVDKFRPDIEADSIFASGNKRTLEGRLGLGTKSISAAALKGTNAVWHHQGDPNQTRFNAAQKDAGEWTKGAAAEMEAALDAGYKFKNHRAGKLGTVWVLEKDGRVLTERGAKSLLAGTGKINLPAATDRETAGEHIKAAASFIRSLPESTQNNFGALVAAINRSPLGDHIGIDRDRNGMLRMFPKGEKNWFVGEPENGHDAEGNWHRNLESNLPRFLAKLDHMAANDISEAGHWTTHDRNADEHARQQHPITPIPKQEHSPAMQSAIAAAHQQLHEAGLAEKPE